MIAVLCFLLLFILCLFWLNNICTCDPVQKGTGEEASCAPQALSSHLTTWIPLIQGSRASPSWTPSFRVWSSGWLVAGLCAALLHCWAGQRMLSVLQLLGGAFENNQHTIWTAAKVCCWLALVLFLIVLMERVASYPWDAFFKSIFDVLALELPGFRGCTEKGGWLVLLQSSPLGTLWTLSKGDSEPSLPWWVIWDQLLQSFLSNSDKEYASQCRRCRFNPDSLEMGMVTPSNILMWEIPWTEEPGRLQSLRSQKSQTQLRD